ncbi:hypothetical protein RRSWK_04934 [Rhodopirellula sp. SWK7]|nr:hypothetical protein RRSWK_04934 [Rhodopirellula sp. SWK7]
MQTPSRTQYPAERKPLPSASHAPRRQIAPSETRTTVEQNVGETIYDQWGYSQSELRRFILAHSCWLDTLRTERLSG